MGTTKTNCHQLCSLIEKKCKQCVQAYMHAAHGKQEDEGSPKGALVEANAADWGAD